MRPRLAIFDFDGTLADTGAWFVDALNEAAARFGFRSIGAEEAEWLRGQSSREIVRALNVPWWKLPSIAAYMRRKAAADLDRIALFPGAAALLRDAVRAGITVAIVSSNSEATIRAVLGPEAASMVAIFECGASLFGKSAKLKDALRRSGYPKEAAIAIGDETRDIEAARAAGIASGAVLWGYASPELLRHSDATHLFESFDALRAFLGVDRRETA